MYLNLDKNQITLRMAIEEYCQIRKIKDSTRKSYKSDMHTVSDWLDLPITSFDKKTVLERYETMLKRAPALTNRTFRLLRAVFNFCGHLHDIESNPFMILTAIRAWKPNPKRKTFLGPEHLRAWWASVSRYSNETIRDFMFTLLLTGARRNEISCLKWKTNAGADDNYIDLDRRLIHLHNTKNGRDHEIYVTDFLFELLSERRRDSESVFVFPTRWSSKKPLSEWNKSNLRISDFSFVLHDLRRTYASMAQDAGVPKEMVRKILNHSDRDVSDGYLCYWFEQFKKPMQQTENRILYYAGIAPKQDGQRAYEFYKSILEAARQYRIEIDIVIELLQQNKGLEYLLLPHHDSNAVTVIQDVEVVR